MGSPEERKVKSLGELSQGIEPPRELWPQIEARLRAPVEMTPSAAVHPAAWPRLGPLRWLAAAAMVASVAVGVWIGRDLLPLSGGGTLPPPQIGAVQPGHANSEAAALDASLCQRPALPARAQRTSEVAAGAT